MNNELVIEVASSGISIALLEDKKLVELNRDKNSEQFSVADIYLGKVKKIMPALNAAFVDIGHEKDAFLHYLDLGFNFQSLNNYILQNTSGKGRFIPYSKARKAPYLEKEGKIANYLKQGQPIMVQIVKESISTKGPRLTSEISIAGRNMVLIPFSDKVSISQKIASVEEKKRLKRLVESIIPSNYGVIIRTAAEGKKVAVLDSELRGLIKRWETCCEKLSSFKKPELLMNEISRTSAILRDMLNGSFNSIHVDDEGVYEEIKEYVGSIAPEKEKIVKLYNGNVPIFDQYNVSKQIKTLFGRVVPLRSGAYLIIEHTEALHVIDVNSGIRAKSGNNQETNALEVNLMAAEEIARQLKLRDMGGIIVVDFIDMYDGENRQILYNKMQKLMEGDRAKHNMLPLSKFGLMQITRQRVRPETHINTNETCPTCHGTGQISPSVLFDIQLHSQLDYYVKKKKEKYLTLKVHPYVASFLTKGLFSKRLYWSFKLKCLIRVKSVPSFTFLEFEIVNRKGEKLTE
ncbi:MAG: Rne/Rng family ribonuclease [Prevotellaceae bacterium]|jgi:ribonuclease G|nr:Rne/Rng family ribonuclease [Prevotellaceae bacterium]